ncbi:hypothetical protein [Plantactinospora sp. DSM 117369]
MLSLIACGVAGLVFVNNELDPLPVQSRSQVASAAQVEAIAHATLPPGTVLLSAVYTRSPRTYARTAAKIPGASSSAAERARWTPAPLTIGTP